MTPMASRGKRQNLVRADCTVRNRAHHTSFLDRQEVSAMYLLKTGLLHQCFNFGAFVGQSKTL
jgi:hypothetical protein